MAQAPSARWECWDQYEIQEPPFQRCDLHVERLMVLTTKELTRMNRAESVASTPRLSLL